MWEPILGNAGVTGQCVQRAATTQITLSTALTARAPHAPATPRGLQATITEFPSALVDSGASLRVT